MNENVKRVYVDTTVVLGNFDICDNRRCGTEMFWKAVRSGEIVAIVSDVLRNELKGDNVERALRFLATFPKTQIVQVLATTDSDDLAELYIRLVP